MKAKIPLIAATVFLALFAMGMGQAPTAGRNSIESHIDARVMDTANNEVKLSSVTLDGRAALDVSLGKGRVQIPLENITRIENKNGEICVTIKGSTHTCGLKAGGSTRILGKTGIGNYQIPLKDIAWAEFFPTTPK